MFGTGNYRAVLSHGLLPAADFAAVLSHGLLVAEVLPPGEPNEGWAARDGGAGWVATDAGVTVFVAKDGGAGWAGRP